jgi:hypothetical protein
LDVVEELQKIQEFEDRTIEIEALLWIMDYNTTNC